MAPSDPDKHDGHVVDHTRPTDVTGVFVCQRCWRRVDVAQPHSRECPARAHRDDE